MGYADQEALISLSPEKVKRLKDLVNEQADDEGLWSVPWEGLQPIAEAYLQQELRKLHALIEEIFKGT